MDNLNLSVLFYMLVKTYGSAVHGVNATTITIEVSVAQGIKFFLVGLPDSAIKESQQRIESAITIHGFRMPGKKIVINMAPADIRKEGSSYDLPIAIGILAASGQVPADQLDQFIIMGELSLDGGLMPARGALPMAIQAKAEGFKGIILPQENADEASLVNGIDVYGLSHLSEVVELLSGQSSKSPHQTSSDQQEGKGGQFMELDFSDVKGQENIKRALEIAAAGGHNVILIGPPGAGKTMLAKRLPGILPPFSMEEALETTKIHSVAGKMGKHTTLIRGRPFRSPHHTISEVI